MKDVLELIELGRYKDAADLAVYRELTYEARSAFVKAHVVENKMVEHYDAYEILLLADARTDFDCYCRFIDYRQPLRRNFYLDRQNYLQDIVDAITNMFFPKKPEYEIDTIRIKLRTRSGKSEIINRAVIWVQSALGYGETLYAVGGGRLKESIHEKRVQFIEEYWDRHLLVFPELDKPYKVLKGDTAVWFTDKEYADIATVTVGGSIEGFVQATNLLVLDDLVASNEINSVRRLEDIFTSDIGNAITRRIADPDNIKRILIGTPIPTLTGVEDPLDRYYAERLAFGDRCKEFIVPSIDENGESNYAQRNFDKDPRNPRWIFTKEKLQLEKEAIDANDNPIVRATWYVLNQMEKMITGTEVFANIKYYDPKTETPLGKYRELTLYDPADSGADYAVCIHGRIYDSQRESVYIHDIFRSRKPMIKGDQGHLNELVDFFIRNDIKTFEYESNLGGELLGQSISEVAKDKNWRIDFSSFKQSKNKIQRIHDNSGRVIDHVFMRSDAPHKDYNDADIAIRGWNENSKHDDDIDALTMIVERLFNNINNKNDYYIGKIM